MNVAYGMIAVLAVAAAALELVKIMYSGVKSGEALSIGSCMTIGSRDVQEDCMGHMTTAAGTMAVLADGAGKKFGGRIAGRTAVETCLDLYKDYNAFHNPQYYFRKAFHCANKEILKALGDENRGSASAGCALVRDGYLYYALAGNIKICVFREESLVPLSAGHTVAVLAEQRFHEGRISRQDALALLENHRLYNYLGKDDFKDIEYFDAPVRLRAGDIIVLMSDGVYGLLGARELEEVLAGPGGCQDKALQVIERVNRDAAEDKDNASIILIGVGNGAIRSGDIQ